MKSTVSGRCFATCKFESIATCKQLGGRAEISSVSRVWRQPRFGGMRMTQAQSWRESG